jgi:hypothetical protein
MPLPEPTDHSPPDTRHARRMVACMLAGPVLFLTVLTLVYTWASGFCQQFNRPGQLALTAIPALVTALLALVCARELASVRNVSSDDPALSRARLVARVGLHLNAYSAILLISLLAPILLLRPCE